MVRCTKHAWVFTFLLQSIWSAALQGESQWRNWRADLAGCKYSHCLKTSMGWSKAQWIQGKQFILLIESPPQVSGSCRVCLFPERKGTGSQGWPQHRQCPHQGGSSPTAPEQGKAAGSIDCPRWGKAMNQVQHPFRESSQEQKETGIETRLQCGSKVHPGGMAEDMTEGKLQGGIHPGNKLCTT